MKPRRHRAEEGRLSHPDVAVATLTVWRSDGGSVVPCWPGSRGVLSD